MYKFLLLVEGLENFTKTIWIVLKSDGFYLVIADTYLEKCILARII